MLPDRQRTLVLNAYAGVDGLTVEDRPVLPPGKGEALVRVAASPINPSDLGFIWGGYGFQKPLPCIPGFEASGTIVAVGEGVDEARVGQRVACLSGVNDDGTWTQYMRIRAGSCLPVDSNIDLEQASMLIANPLSVWALFDLAGSSPAIIQTASASALGRMVIRLAQQRGIELINIIRHDDQIDILRDLGAKYILNSSAPDFEDRLRQLILDLDAHVAFDAVAGDLGSLILRLMPDHSRHIFYSGMSGVGVSVGIGDLAFNAKTLEGFWLIWWIPENPDKLAVAWREIQANIDIYKTEIRARYSLDSATQALAEFAANMRGGMGKMLLMP